MLPTRRFDQTRACRIRSVACFLNSPDRHDIRPQGSCRVPPANANIIGCGNAQQKWQCRSEASKHGDYESKRNRRPMGMHTLNQRIDSICLRRRTAGCYNSSSTREADPALVLCGAWGCMSHWRPQPIGQRAAAQAEAAYQSIDGAIRVRIQPQHTDSDSNSDLDPNARHQQHWDAMGLRQR